MQNNGNQQTTAQIECANPECKVMLELLVPEPCVVNSMAISSVHWMHPEIQICPNCGTHYQMQLKQITGAQVIFGPVKAPGQGNRIVVPPIGASLPPFPGRGK